MREPRALSGSEAAEKPIFGFISGVAALCFAMLLLSTVWIAFPQTNVTAVAFNAVIVAFLAADSVFDLYIRFRSSRKSIVFRKFRSVLALVVVSYAALSPFGGGKFPYLFLPNFVNVAGTVAILFESLIVYSIRNVLFSRSELYAMLAGQRETENVTELFSANARLVFDAYGQAQSLRRSAILLFGAATLLIVTQGYFEASVSFIAGFWYIAALSSAFGLFAIANGYLDEHRFFAHGIVAPPRYQRFRQNWSYLTIVVCGVIALLAAADRSPFKPSDILAFFAWIASWFVPRNAVDIAQVEKAMNRIATPPMHLSAMFPDAGSQAPNPFWPAFFEVLKWVGIAIVTAAAIFFIVRPMLAKDFNLRASLALFFRQLGVFLAAPFVTFWRSIQALLSWRSNGNKRKKPAKSAATPRDYIDSLIKSLGLGNAGRSALQYRSLTIYAGFLEWLYQKDLRWSLSDTPYDIAAIAAGAFSAVEPAAGAMPLSTFDTVSTPPPADIAPLSFEIADILEKDLYSAGRASDEEVDRMQDLVEELKTRIKSRRDAE